MKSTQQRPRASQGDGPLPEPRRINAVSQLLGYADEATTLRFYVRDSFNDEELFEERL
jgi:hypothetical protein